MKIQKTIISAGRTILRSVGDTVSSISGLITPEGWLKDYFMMGIASSGVPVNEKSINQITAWTSGVRLIAETIGSLPLQNIRTSGDRHIKEKSDIWFLMARKPNSFMTSNIFWELVAKYCIHRGNHFSVIIRNNDYKVQEVIPIHEDRSVDVIFSNNRKYYRISGISEILDQDQVLHFMALGDGIKGISLIEYIATSAGITLASQKNEATFFKNGSQLQGVLEHPKQLKKESANRLRKDWHQIYHNPEGSDNRVAILEEGMTYKTISIDPAAAKLLDTLKKGNIDVSRILRLPPYMLMEMDGATYSNIEHQGLEFVKYTLTTWLSRFEREMWDKLYTEKEKRSDELKWKFNVEGLLRGDFKTRMEGYRVAINAGLKSQNECRALEDMDPFEGGDRRWIQMNMMPLDKADQILNRSTIEELLKKAQENEEANN
ncbi:phage portal protein [Echinicola strongylocentroti]|uniref:Phage portal protein n=1 Tax=Echinicola strongylocentroti TaxID=1795355 RepID=A0A2Z4INP6_9BACT|nr:phage portal protein [Echinicola strongylocentroti]AWW32166.1 phage portal protein [Echinicola strongylocentroti]